MAVDYYELLGVTRNASQDEIKRAYRRLARELHPDTGHGDADSEARFKEVTRAYEVLRDPEKRRRYDMFGPEGNGATAGDAFGFGGLSDMFEAFFGGGSPFGTQARAAAGSLQGADRETVAELDFTEAVFGCKKTIPVRTAVACATCEATGAEPGSEAVVCPECGGSGQVQRIRQSLFGQMQMVTASVCPRCGGAGQLIARPCHDCRGEGRRMEERKYTIDIPGGVDTGSSLRLSGRGDVGPRGGPAGDLYVHLRVRPDERFERDGVNLIAQLRVPYTQAVLGASVPFETLDGPVDLELARGTASGTVMRLRGRGVPHVERGTRGDLLINILVDVPTDLSEEQEEALRQFASLRGEEVAEPPAGGMFSKLRSALK